MKKRIIKKYHLKEGVKTVIAIIILLSIVTMYLLYASNRIERIENTNDTTQKSVNVNIMKK